MRTVAGDRLAAGTLKGSQNLVPCALGARLPRENPPPCRPRGRAWGGCGACWFLISTKGGLELGCHQDPKGRGVEGSSCRHIPSVLAATTLRGQQRGSPGGPPPASPFYGQLPSASSGAAGRPAPALPKRTGKQMGGAAMCRALVVAARRRTSRRAWGSEARAASVSCSGPRGALWRTRRPKPHPRPKPSGFPGFLAPHAEPVLGLCPHSW